MSNEICEQKRQKVRKVWDFSPDIGTPVLAACSGWLFYSMGVNAYDAYHDYKLLEKTVADFFKQYDFDCSTNSFANYAFPVVDTLGGGNYKIDRETGALSVLDNNFIFPEDYEEAAKDIYKFNKKAFARKFPNMTTEKFGKAMSLFLEFGQFSARNNAFWNDTVKLPLMYDSTRMIMPTLEILNASTRGIKDLSIDIRRHKEALKKYIDAYWDQMFSKSLAAAKLSPDTTHISDISTSMLVHSILNVKQFEELYWPQMKQVVDAAVECGYRYYVLSEAQFERFADFVRDVPKGTMLIYVEQDDLPEMRSKLPNIALAGGVPTTLLGYATPERVYEYTKELADKMGPGFAVAPDKVLAYANDAKKETLPAMISAVRN